MPILELKDVRYSYSPEKVVLRGMSCAFECGTLYALVGKSGAGKSTLLSLMAGLDLPESGQVLFDGTPTGDMDLDEYRRRKAAVIYQDFALFPMLTALENIEYPMELCHVDAKEARQQALELARRVSLPDELLDRYPTHISGGEQQRVALARILCTRPEAILLDEPFSALDSFLKWKLELELSDFLENFSGPILWVSHDRGEVFRNCKKVCVMEQGQSQGMFTLRQLFHEPETEAAARLSGCKNIVEAVPAGNAVTLPQWGLTLDCGKAVPADVRWAGIRAHHVTAAPEGTEGAFLCAVERVIQDVFTTIVLLRPEGAASGAPLLRMELEREDAPTVLDNQLVWISVQPRDILLLR